MLGKPELIETLMGINIFKVIKLTGTRYRVGKRDFIELETAREIIRYKYKSSRRTWEVDPNSNRNSLGYVCTEYRGTSYGHIGGSSFISLAVFDI